MVDYTEFSAKLEQRKMMSIILHFTHVGQMALHINIKKYGENEVDYFFFYCMENGYKALVPISDVKGGEFIIRFSLPRNGQKVGIHMAADYALDVQLAKLCKSENTVKE